MDRWPAFWTELIQEAFGKGTRLVFPRFIESKKNQVTLMELACGDESMTVLAKYFVWGRCGHEFSITRQAHDAGLTVPRPIVRVRNVIFFEPVTGTALKSIDLHANHADVHALGLWLARFHAAMRSDGQLLLRGDCVLPNFLRSPEGVIYGVDFEEAGPGDVHDELAELCVSLLIAPPSPADAEPDLKAVRTLVEAYQQVAATPLRWETLRGSMGAALESRARCLPARAEEFRSYQRYLQRAGIRP